MPLIVSLNFQATFFFFLWAYKDGTAVKIELRSKLDSMELHSCLWNAVSCKEVLRVRKLSVLVVRFDSFAMADLVKFFHWWCWVIYLSENVLIFWDIHFRKCSYTVFLHMFASNFIAIPISYHSSCWHGLKGHINLWKCSKEIFQKALEENWSKEGIKAFLKGKFFRIYVSLLPTHHWYFV